MSRLGLRPRTSSAVTSAEIGPAVKPIQGNMFMKNPGSPGTSPRIGFQSSVPLTIAGQTAQQPRRGQRRHHMLSDGEIGAAANRNRPPAVAGVRASGSSAPASRRRSGRCRCAPASGSASRRRNRRDACTSGATGSVTLTWIGWPWMRQLDAQHGGDLRPPRRPPQLTTRRAWMLPAAGLGAIAAAVLGHQRQSARCVRMIVAPWRRGGGGEGGVDLQRIGLALGRAEGAADHALRSR